MAQKAMQKRYYYTDVHVHGVYPPNIIKHWERKGFSIDCTDEDLTALKEGCVDYIGFSYYMTFAIEHKDANKFYEYDDARLRAVKSENVKIFRIFRKKVKKQLKNCLTNVK